MADLDAASLRSALADLASRLEPGREVEMLLVGGAAALLGGLLPPEATTLDCDVAQHARSAWPHLQRAAEEVALARGLSPVWLNTECQQSASRRLPPGWRDRAIVHRFGVLRVLTVARRDYIAMKVIAGREKDIEHLRHLEPLAGAEIDFAHTYLLDLARRFPQEAPFADDALLLLHDLASRSRA
jgi:hypothetical protein